MIDHVAGDDLFVQLYRLNLIPLYVVGPCLLWVLHDYFVTVEDEVTYVWNQKAGFGKFMFFWIRYYTIFLLVFDVVQIHSFAIPGVPSLDLCVATDPITRMAGALSLWSVEIIMQMRIYVLYNRSKKVALFNGILFVISIALFLSLMIVNAIQRKTLIADAVRLPLPGCPAINGNNTQWALWIPATLFEFVLFGFAIYKSAVSTAANVKLNQRTSLTGILLQENILYFLIVACLLIFNNMMAVGATRIPWFGFGPFHAGLGITTGRMMIHLRKFAIQELEGSSGGAAPLPEMRFAGNLASNPIDHRRSCDSDVVSQLSYDIENASGTSIHEDHFTASIIDEQQEAGPSSSYLRVT